MLKWLSKRIDQNPTLANLLSRLSTTMAVYRGLPTLVGTGLVIISLVLSTILIPLLVSATEADGLWLLLCLPALLLHLGTITALIGLMMVEPLGKGYRE